MPYTSSSPPSCTFSSDATVFVTPDNSHLSGPRKAGVMMPPTRQHRASHPAAPAPSTPLTPPGKKSREGPPRQCMSKTDLEMFSEHFRKLHAARRSTQAPLLSSATSLTAPRRASDHSGMLLQRLRTLAGSKSTACESTDCRTAEQNNSVARGPVEFTSYARTSAAPPQAPKAILSRNRGQTTMRRQRLATGKAGAPEAHREAPLHRGPARARRGPRVGPDARPAPFTAVSGLCVPYLRRERKRRFGLRTGGQLVEQARCGA